MQTFKNVIGRINRYCSEVCGWLLCVIMILLIVDFVGRGISRPIQGVGEIAVFVMVAVVYLGVPHTEQTRGHVRVTALIKFLSPRLQRMTHLIVHLLALATVAVAVWAVTQNAIKAFRSQEAVAGTVPLVVWPVKFVIVFGCVALLFATRGEHGGVVSGLVCPKPLNPVLHRIFSSHPKQWSDTSWTR